MFNPISNADPSKLYGAENTRPETAGAQQVLRARNPILEPGTERHNTRRSFAPAASLEVPIFEGHRRGKGAIGEDCAGLLSARRSEILFSDVPPRKAHPHALDGLAGLGSAEALDLPRGKARPMTASSAINRNPLLLTAESSDALKPHMIAEGVAAHFKGRLGPDLLPVEPEGGETARLARRPATARPEDLSSGAAGAPSRLLHRFENGNEAHVKAHTPRIPSAGIEDVLHYRYAGGNSTDAGCAIESRASERERYEAELRLLHQGRTGDARACDARVRGIEAAAGK